MPIFKDLDLLIGFILLMLAAGTVVATATEFAASLTHMRSRYLHLALEELLTQIAPPLSPRDAHKLASFLLRHPWLRGRANTCAASLHRADFVRLLLDAAAGPSPLSARLRIGFDFSNPQQARELSQAIGFHALRLELECPAESARTRDTKAIISAIGPHPLLALIHTWYGHAMLRATQRYMRQTRLITAGLALALVLLMRIDLLACFHVPSSSRWPGLVLSWILLSLGTPFWYDRLKDLLHFRPSST